MTDTQPPSPTLAAAAIPGLVPGQAPAPGGVSSAGETPYGGPPVRGGGNQGYHTGCHIAVMSALTALLYRATSGQG